MTAKKFNNLGIFDGDKIIVTYKTNGRKGAYTLIDFCEEEECIVVLDEKDMIYSFPLEKLRSIKRDIADDDDYQDVLNNIEYKSLYSPRTGKKRNDIECKLLQLPRTDKRGKLVPQDERVRIVKEYFPNPPGTDLDECTDAEKYFFEIFQTYGQMNFDKLSKNERGKFFHFYLNEAYNIIEEVANYILFVDYKTSKAAGILSPRTLKRRKEYEDMFSDEEPYDKKGEINQVHEEMYESGVYDKDYYKQAEFDLLLDSEFEDEDLQMMTLFSQSYTQEEVAEIMNTTRSKIRTRRKNLGKAYRKTM